MDSTALPIPKCMAQVIWPLFLYFMRITKGKILIKYIPSQWNLIKWQNTLSKQLQGKTQIKETRKYNYASLEELFHLQHGAN